MTLTKKCCITDAVQKKYVAIEMMALRKKMSSLKDVMETKYGVQKKEVAKYVRSLLSPPLCLLSSERLPSLTSMPPFPFPHPHPSFSLLPPTLPFASCHDQRKCGSLARQPYDRPFWEVCVQSKCHFIFEWQPWQKTMGLHVIVPDLSNVDTSSFALGTVAR